MDDDREELLARMYNSAIEEPTPKTSPVVQSSGIARTRRIAIGAISYEVPTIEYCAHLERLITAQASVIEQNKRDIKRIEGLISNIRQFIKKHSVKLLSMSHEIDQKIDRRD